MNKTNVLLEPSLALYFPLKKYGYRLERVLNDEKRWHFKRVYHILDKDFTSYVSTTYAEQSEYLKLRQTISLLKTNHKLSPAIIKLYPRDKTVVCNYLGEFLPDYLLNNSNDITLSLTAILDYLQDINSINQSRQTFVIPSLIKTSLRLSEEFGGDFEFLPQARTSLTQLEDSGIKFLYGYGIEDPHIWNFRVADTSDKLRALTTDFDYFSAKVNCFWELGYLYATFRWFKKISFSLAGRAEEILLSLVQNQDLNSEFMFWLGVLSSYCGYRDKLIDLMRNKGITNLRETYRFIQHLDEKVSHLARQLLAKESCSESFKYAEICK